MYQMPGRCSRTQDHKQDLYFVANFLVECENCYNHAEMQPCQTWNMYCFTNGGGGTRGVALTFFNLKKHLLA